MRLVNLDDPIEFLPDQQRVIIRSRQAGRYVELGPLFGALGINFEMIEMPNDLSGECSFEPGVSPTGFMVRVNRRHSMERRRFTAAHEMGHCLLHAEIIKQKAKHDQLLGSLNRDWDPAFCDLLGDFVSDPFANTDEQRREIEANRFAAAMLMPARVLNKLWRSGVRDTGELARRVGVTQHAMKRRLRELRQSSSRCS